MLYSLVIPITSLAVGGGGVNIFVIHPVHAGTVIICTKKIKTGFQLQRNSDVTVETGIISGVLLNNKVGGRLELISNLMV